MIDLFDSAAKEKALQKSHELYVTPAECAAKAFEIVDVGAKTRLLEPACNNGPFCAEAKKRGAHATGIDSRSVDSFAGDEFICADFLSYETISKFDIIMFNPPFSKTQQFVEAAKAMLHPAGSIVFLQRLDILGGIGRHPWWKTTGLTDVLVLPKRYSFRSDGQTDQYFYAYFKLRPCISNATPSLRWASLEERP